MPEVVLQSLPTEQNPNGTPNNAPIIWNPTVAVYLGLLFTPLFSAVIQYLNWKTLGQRVKVKSSIAWISIWAVVILGNILCRIRFAGPIHLTLFVIWFFAFAFSQIRYIEDEFRSEYKRKSWRIPVLIGIGFILVSFIAECMKDRSANLAFRNKYIENSFPLQP